VYDDPILPLVKSATMQCEHTVMTILPRQDWANLFIEWTKELKEKHELEGGNEKYQLE